MTDKKDSAASGKKKKVQKMSLGDFLSDPSTGGAGSWAAEVGEDFVLPSGPIGISELPLPTSSSALAATSSVSSFHSDYSSRRSESPSFGSVHWERLPIDPPFTAFIGNLPFDIKQEEIASSFPTSQISSITLPKGHDGRLKGFGYIQFEDLESLKSALETNGKATVRGRRVRLDIAEQKESIQRDHAGGAGRERQFGQWTDKKSPSSLEMGRQSWGSRSSQNMPSGGGSMAAAPMSLSASDWRSSSSGGSSFSSSVTGATSATGGGGGLRRFPNRFDRESEGPVPGNASRKFAGPYNRDSSESPLHSSMHRREHLSDSPHSSSSSLTSYTSSASSLSSSFGNKMATWRSEGSTEKDSPDLSREDQRSSSSPVSNIDRSERRNGTLSSSSKDLGERFASLRSGNASDDLSSSPQHKSFGKSASSSTNTSMWPDRRENQGGHRSTREPQSHHPKKEYSPQGEVSHHHSGGRSVPFSKAETVSSWRR